MITDRQTNFLYLADTLPKKYSDFYKQFESVLKDCNIPFDFLPQAKGVWSVDYMPIANWRKCSALAGHLCLFILPDCIGN